MLNIRLSDRVLTANPRVLAVAVRSGPRPAIVAGSGVVHADLRTQLAAFLTDSDHDGGPGTIAVLPRPLAMPRRVLLVGVGDGGANGWRAAGAALARAAAKDDALDVAMPDGTDRDAVRGLAEGLWLASYSFNLTRRIVEPENDAESPNHERSASRIRRHSVEEFVDGEPDLALRKVTLLVTNADDPNLHFAAALAEAYSVASATRFARDL